MSRISYALLFLLLACKPDPVAPEVRFTVDTIVIWPMEFSLEIGGQMDKYAVAVLRKGNTLYLACSDPDWPAGCDSARALLR